jgi:hypothetical protein
MDLFEMVRLIESLPSPANTTTLLCLELAARQRRLQEESRFAHSLPTKPTHDTQLEE